MSNHEGQVEPLINSGSLFTLERSLVSQGYDAGVIWESAEAWNIPSSTISNWERKAARGIAHAIVSACSVIDFECIKVDGRLPYGVRQSLVAEIDRQLPDFNLTGLERPRIEAGTVGPDAPALGAASLPLSERYLLDDPALRVGSQGRNMPILSSSPKT